MIRDTVIGVPPGHAALHVVILSEDAPSDPHSPGFREVRADDAHPSRRAFCFVTRASRLPLWVVRSVISSEGFSPSQETCIVPRDAKLPTRTQSHGWPTLAVFA